MDPIKKKRGRPVGSGRNPDKPTYHILVTDSVKLMLDGWKKEYNARSYDEAIRKAAASVNGI
jgi:hypothetical protein